MGGVRWMPPFRFASENRLIQVRCLPPDPPAFAPVAVSVAVKPVGGDIVGRNGPRQAWPLVKVVGPTPITLRSTRVRIPNGNRALSQCGILRDLHASGLTFPTPEGRLEVAPQVNSGGPCGLPTFDHASKPRRRADRHFRARLK
jgi:hypothetical protein